MEKPTRTPFICKQCQKHYPSREFQIRKTCVICFMVILFDCIAELNKKTLIEQVELLRKVEYGTQCVNAAIKREIKVISKMMKRKE